MSGRAGGSGRVSNPPSGDGRERTDGDRAQLVLVAAAVIAIAMIPILAAYLQLGYTGDAAARDGFSAPARNAERVLERSVDNASEGIPGEYRWTERRAAVRAVKDRLAGPFDALRTGRGERGTVTAVAYNQSAARRWADRNCPAGPDRQFGACEAVDGVVVQNRTGRTHVVLVAVDVTVTTERRRVEMTLLVRAVGGTD